MIVELILAAFANAFQNLFSVGPLAGLDLPSLSDEVMAHMYSYLDLFGYARSFITFFIPPDAFEFGVEAFALLFLTEKLYPLLMWIIRKIPLLNIS